LQILIEYLICLFFPKGESYHACNLPKEEIIKQYTELVSGLDGVDLFLIETMHNLDEVKYAVSICKEIFGDSITIWISFNPRHKHINSNDNTVCIQDGTSIRDVINELLKLNVKALLFNCATPEIISLAIKEAGLILKELGWKDKIKIGGYANIWEEMDLTNWSIEKNESAPGASDQKKGGMIVRNDIFGSPQLYLAKVQEWKNDGASILGGCCGIGPEHIQHMCKNLKPN
jgi:S-methylmethionine-dependent homocysteine/selenocysteine methylase